LLAAKSVERRRLKGASISAQEICRSDQSLSIPIEQILPHGLRYALTDLIAWKLTTSPDSKIRLSEKQIGVSMAKHLAPFLFPGRSGLPPRFDLLEAFKAMLAAQVEMNEFISRSVDAHR